MPRTIRKYWGPLNGRVRLNYNWDAIFNTSTVLVTASEYDKDTRKRFIGDATITVDNIEPHSPPWDPNNGVTFVITVDWPSPLPVVTDIILLVPKPFVIDFPPPPPPPPPPIVVSQQPPPVSVPPPPPPMNVNNIDNVTFSSAADEVIERGFRSSSDQTETLDQIIDQSIAYFESSSSARQGQLVVVGGGIRAICDMTLDAEAQIRAAEKVLYCVGIQSRKEGCTRSTLQRSRSIGSMATTSHVLIPTARWLRQFCLQYARDCAYASFITAIPAFLLGPATKLCELHAEKGFVRKCTLGFPPTLPCSQIWASIRRNQAATRLRQQNSWSINGRRTSAHTSCCGRWNALGTSASTFPATSDTTSTS
jgi:hypothetical protein